MLYAAKSHIGLVRQMNQDGYAVLPHLKPREFYVIADGMGGPSAGEVASQIAVDTVSAYVTEHGAATDVNPADLLREAVYEANQKIFDAAQSREEYLGMGTTLVCALVDPERVVFAHVGDSRGYVLQEGKLRQVTSDHSLVAELVRRGQLTEEEAQHHPQRNIVTRSLGTEAHSSPDIYEVEWCPGDILFLCSDGLSNMVDFAELEGLLHNVSSAKTPDQLDAVADALIRLALERGGPDNITLVIVLNREGGETA